MNISYFAFNAAVQVTRFPNTSILRIFFVAKQCHKMFTAQLLT